MMGNGPRDYSAKTLKRLFALSGNQCAFPGCSKPMVNHKNAKDSNICHIEAAHSGGERYNPHMSDEQRADYDNLILLCVQHHDETNDVNIYTVEKMKAIKKQHESLFLYERIGQRPSMLKNTINALSKIEIDVDKIDTSYKIIDPSDKIEHNKLKLKASVIREYTAFHSKLNVLYNELELQGSIKKQKLLETIKLTYEKVKSGIVKDASDPLKEIQENSDLIYDMVYSALNEKLEDSQFYDEDIILGLNVVMADAFVRCKILEEPLK